MSKKHVQFLICKDSKAGLLSLIDTNKTKQSEVTLLSGSLHLGLHNILSKHSCRKEDNYCIRLLCQSFKLIFSVTCWRLRCVRGIRLNYNRPKRWLQTSKFVQVIIILCF